MGKATPADLATKLQTEPGFTVRPSSGRSPSSGKMVSKFGSEVIVEGTATKEHIAGYMEHFKPEGYFGAWKDNGKTYLDQSVRVKSDAAAQDFGKKNAQRAYYDVDNDSVKPVEYVAPRGFEGSLFEGHEDEGQKYHGLVNEQRRMGVERDLNEKSLAHGATKVTRVRAKAPRQQRLFR